MTTDLIWITPIALGAAHAFDADHVVAVSTLATTAGRPSGAVRLALVWGLGHMVPLLAVAAIAILLGWEMPPWVAAAAERSVGPLLVTLGAITLIGLRSRRIHIHTHRHAGVRHMHFHAHGRRWGDHHHAHAAVLTGAVHGLAGSAAPIVLVPVSAGHAPIDALIFVGAFGVSVAMTMAAYALCLGQLTATLGERGRLASVALQCSAALACVGIGFAWTIR